MVEFVGEVGEHAGGGDVHERDRFGVEHDGVNAVARCGPQNPSPDTVSVREVQAAFDAEDREVDSTRLGALTIAGAANAATIA